MKLTGDVIKYGDNVDTDVIIPTAWRIWTRRLSGASKRAIS
jgi:3-isopropylmalate dehydratase small subunit